MTGRNRFVLIVILAVVLLLAGCAGQQEPPPERQSGVQIILPEPEKEEQVFTLASIVAQIYYDFFSSSFEIVEARHMLGTVQIWGHRVGDEVQLPEHVFIYRIEGFDDPVLFLVEFTLTEEGYIGNMPGFANAHLIRGGELCRNLSCAEFDMIFSSERRGVTRSVRCQCGSIRHMNIRGVNLLSFRLHGAQTADGAMNILLNKLREHF